jgi:hypothetical protein
VEGLRPPATSHAPSRNDRMAGTAELAGGQITVVTARRIRLLYDVEAAALARTAVLLGMPVPGQSGHQLYCPQRLGARRHVI